MALPSAADAGRIASFETLLELLKEKMDWPVEPSAVIEDVTFEYSADELRVGESHAARRRSRAARVRRVAVTLNGESPR